MIQGSSNLAKQKYQEKGDLGSIREADSAILELISEDDAFTENSYSNKIKSTSPKMQNMKPK